MSAVGVCEVIGIAETEIPPGYESNYSGVRKGSGRLQEYKLPGINQIRAPLIQVKIKTRSSEILRLLPV
jgi:hypothetical protein